jgi:hypothetical protein
MFSIISSIVSGSFNIFCSLLKYGFYTTVLGLTGVSIFLYHTKPTNFAIKVLENTSLVEDWVILKYVNLSEKKKYIGIANRWIHL